MEKSGMIVEVVGREQGASVALVGDDGLNGDQMVGELATLSMRRRPWRDTRGVGYIRRDACLDRVPRAVAAPSKSRALHARTETPARRALTATATD
jgi:hypothetical protein